MGSGRHRGKCRRSNRAVPTKLNVAAILDSRVLLGMNILTTYTASMKRMMGLGSLALALGLASGQSAKSPQTDAEIKQAIIAESIARYKGSCPCPYNTDRAGRRCGARSAYTRPGGASPLCYEKDVTQKMVDDYRKKHSH